MRQFFRNLFAKTEEPVLPAVPVGQRIYAVGDIHGRLDLFEALIAAIEEDDAAAAPAETCVILLGDLVDRGADSAGVIRRARQWQAQRDVRILAGNHEEMFLKSFDSTETLRHFLRHGGRQTMLSYGITTKALATPDIEEVQALLCAAVPPSERAYIESFEDMIRIGDYVFVHAGIDYEVPLDSQRTSDLRWIREPFLSHPGTEGVVVVHGHTISEAPEDRGCRIGIDTGAYTSGRLTAVVLEGTRRRYLEAVQDEAGTITAAPRPL